MSQHVTSFNLYEASEKVTYLQRASFGLRSTSHLTSFDFASHLVFVFAQQTLCPHPDFFLIPRATPLPTYFLLSHYPLHYSIRLLLVFPRPGTIGPQYFFYFDRWHFDTFISNPFVLFPFAYLFLWHISVRLLFSWHILRSLIFVIAYLSIIPFRSFTLFVYTFPRTFAIRRYAYTHCSITLYCTLFRIWLIHL